MRARTLRLILGDQLNAQHSWFKQKDQGMAYLIAELHQEANYVRHHIQKISAFFLAMSNFASALESVGHDVIYLTLDETESFKDLPELITHYIDKVGCHTFEYQQPDEYRLDQQMAEFSGRLNKKGFSTSCIDSEHFYLSRNELGSYFKANTAHKMEFFYRKMRKRFGLLMDDGEPDGGQWNYDQDNRASFNDEALSAIPEPLSFAHDTNDILERLSRHNIETIGHASDKLIWPASRKESKALLAFFCECLLPQFGHFQDAMTHKVESRWSLYHSRLSFSLNSKMISPKEVVDAAISAYRNNKEINLAQIEGFVRQILGWREFVRGIYWLNMPNYAEKNELDVHRSLPSWFWNAETKMHCMKEAITQSLEKAYAHHIQRLMITGNFMLLSGIAPDEADSWYLGIYIDAIEWVEMPNTRGMSQFADGGLLASKPYASSGNYINKMSDYCKPCHYSVSKKSGDGACPFNLLYWRFIAINKDRFERNPRMSMVYRNWNKRDAASKKLIMEEANALLENIEAL